MYDFESNLNTPSYMNSIIDIKTINNNNYNVFVGKIFNAKIKKITDTIYAKIVKINNNTFCYAIIDNKLVDDDYLNYDIKAYDNLENIIE